MNADLVESGCPEHILIQIKNNHLEFVNSPVVIARLIALVNALRKKKTTIKDSQTGFQICLSEIRPKGLWNRNVKTGKRIKNINPWLIGCESIPGANYICGNCKSIAFCNFVLKMNEYHVTNVVLCNQCYNQIIFWIGISRETEIMRQLIINKDDKARNQAITAYCHNIIALCTYHKVN